MSSHFFNINISEREFAKKGELLSVIVKKDEREVSLDHNEAIRVASASKVELLYAAYDRGHDIMEGLFKDY